MTGADGAEHLNAPIKFTPILDDVQAAYSLAAKRPIWPSLLTGVAVGSLYMLLTRINPHATPAEYAAAFAAGLALPFGVRLVWRWLLLPHRVRKLYYQQVGLRLEHIIWWDEAGLHAQNSQTTSLLHWDAFTKRRENGLTLLLYQSDAMFQFVPKRVLTDTQAASLAMFAQRVPAKG